MTPPNEQAEDPYAAIADLYDLEHGGYDEDVDLYLNVAAVVGDPILELGCGTGRLLVPLARSGFRVAGVDRSATMLARAGAAARRAGVEARVSLAEGAMTEADRIAGGPFGVVIVALNGLLHLPTLDDQRRALAAARRALDPRGQLVIDVFNPSPDALRAFDGGVAHEGAWRLPDGTGVDKFSARRLVASEQRIETELWYDLVDPDGRVRRVRTAYPMRYLHRAELELLLELAGFAEWRIYGGYDLEPFGEGAERLLALAEATPGR